MYDRQCLVRDTLWLFERLGEPSERAMIEQHIQRAEEADAAGDGRLLHAFANAVCTIIVEYARDNGDRITTGIDREIVLDAMVRVDTPHWCTGREPQPIPTAGGQPDEATIFWAIARRQQLAVLSPDALADECRVVVSKAQASIQNLLQIIADAKQRESDKMSKVGGHKHKNKALVNDALRHVGKTLMELHIVRQRACARLEEHPIELPCGIVVKGNKGAHKIEIWREGNLLASRSAEQFRRNFMAKAAG